MANNVLTDKTTIVSSSNFSTFVNSGHWSKKDDAEKDDANEENPAMAWYGGQNQTTAIPFVGNECYGFAMPFKS